jgi:hypothetical protein
MARVKQILQELFPGDQLATLLQIIGAFAMIILFAAMRARLWQDRGGSAVFLTKQRFQSLFGKRKIQTRSKLTALNNVLFKLLCTSIGVTER